MLVSHYLDRSQSHGVRVCESLLLFIKRHGHRTVYILCLGRSVFVSVRVSLMGPLLEEGGANRKGRKGRHEGIEKVDS